MEMEIMEMFDEGNSPHDVLLTARQKTKLRNAFITIC